MYKLFVFKNKTSKEVIDIIKKKYHIEYDIFYNEHGKPYFVGNKLYFNISHSKEYAAIVLSNVEIGIDIQWISDKRHLSDKICIEKEKEIINNDEDFIKIWTKKESYVKKIGIGLSYGLINVDTTKYKFDTFKINNYIISITY